MRSFFTILAALSAVFAAPSTGPKPGSKILNQWIVRLNDGATSEDLQSVLADVRDKWKAQPKHVYDFGGFKGFSMWAQLEAIPTALANDPAIALVEPDLVVTTSTLATQPNPPYGLARISHREKGTKEYLYDSSAGEGSYAYIVDTGIYTNHSEFEGRAVFGENFADSDDFDGNGHGTHVAGTVGGKTYGVAKKSNLIAVKVLGADGVGSLSNVIAGLGWALQHAIDNGRVDKSVVNMSLGGGFSPMTNMAVNAVVNAGLFCAVAAGNSGMPVITASPASAKQACTVGAVDENDVRPSFSNYGFLIDVFAPGVGVQSAWITGPDSSALLSGTSMASPHVAGLGAYLIGLGYGGGGGDELCKNIKTLSTKRAVKNALSPNKWIAFNGNGELELSELGARWSKREVAEG